MRSAYEKYHFIMRTLNNLSLILGIHYFSCELMIWHFIHEDNIKVMDKVTGWDSARWVVSSWREPNRFVFNVWAGCPQRKRPRVIPWVEHSGPTWDSIKLILMVQWASSYVQHDICETVCASLGLGQREKYVFPSSRVCVPRFFVLILTKGLYLYSSSG